jgi:hypothetical protein
MGLKKLQPGVVKWDFLVVLYVLTIQGNRIKIKSPRAARSGKYRVQRGGPTTKSLRSLGPLFPPSGNLLLPFSPSDGRKGRPFPGGIVRAW